jgi:hypothetical protein
MTKIVESQDKLPIPAEESKSQKDAKAAFEKAIADGGRVFNLDNLGIENLAELGPFPETAEEISLFDNEILNPKYIVDILVPLPGLKALWLNNNPVVDACSNFHSISELMPNLEICNSVLTASAGEWAMLYYARDQGAKSIDQIVSLDLSGKGLLYLDSTEVFSKMTGLRRLNMSGHPEFFMTEEAKEALEFKELLGISKEDKKKVTFTEHKSKVEDILSKLNSLEELVCDEDLEQYILENRGTFLPKLKMLNDISIDV